MEDIIIALGIVGIFNTILAICGIFSDYVAPHITWLNRYIDSLPLAQSEEDT